MTTTPQPARLMPWIKALGLCLCLLAANPALAIEKINSTFFGNLAIEGYDPVAYFTVNRAVEGSKQYEFEWMEATWRFSSQRHLDLFKADPEKFAPQYGGYCAYAVSQNTTAGIEPDLFTLANGKLYLNYNKKINQKWLLNKDQYIVDADRFWPVLLNK